MEFKPFDKIPRLSRECIITEKIDGTNGVVGIVTETPESYARYAERTDTPVFTKEVEGGIVCIFAGSRTRWITPEKDNAGFAKWVRDNGEELLKLGEGIHYGEWWGKGIQRGYGLNEKRFSLFNVSRWTDDVRPACCGIVPTLYVGPFDTRSIASVLEKLEHEGSVAVPGFMQPEGIVIFHVASGHLYKKTIKNDESPKGLVNDG